MQQGARNFGRVVAIILVAVAVACAWLPSIQSVADEQVDAGLKRAVVSFAAAKTLNAAISVAQGTEIALQPVGVGLTLTVGQVLDPLNDLVERFADLMLTASVAFGVQKALLAIGAHWLVKAAVTVVAVVWALLYFGGAAPSWLSRVLFVLVMVRFAVPVMAIGSDWVFHGVLADKYEQAQQSLEVIASNTRQQESSVTKEATDKGWVEKLKDWWNKEVPAAQDESFWDTLRKWWGTGSLLDAKARVVELQKAIDGATEKIIDLMVVFVMQTIVVPIVLLWALLKVAGGVLLSRSVATAV